jgi:protein involved in polysaccharide export with SLBB domain
MGSRVIVLVTKGRNLKTAVFAIYLYALFFFHVSYAFAQQPTENQTISASELAKDNLDRVAASESQITGVLNANPGLFVELKRWVARDAADRGQIIRDSDLTDAAILSRLANDSRFRAAATRLLQGYGYLLPKINPDSEVGRQQAALEQERIRELVAVQQGQAQQAQQNQLTKCDPSSANSKCQTNQRPPQKAAVQTGTANPGELPRDRDFGQLLTNPAPQPTSGNGSLLRSSASPIESSGFGFSGGSESDLTLMPISYDRMALPDPDPPPQPTPVTAAPSSAKGASSGGGPLLDVNTQPIESHWSPYSDIPSVYDIFSHSATASNSIARFGEDVFQNPTPASGTIPIDFPASPDYVVGPGDGLTIDLWGGVSQRLVRTVDHEGRIALPEIGPMLVNGQTLGDVQQSVQRLLRTQFRDVSADVSLSRLRTVRVYVVGDVNHPGPYDVSSLSTPLNGLLAAGGPTLNGSMRIVKHYRGNTLVQQVDLYDLLLRGVRTDVKRL